MEHNKHKWTKIRIEFNYIDILMASEELEKALKLTKIGRSPGEANINSEDNKHTPRLS